MDNTANALSEARRRIIDLQEQMSERVLKMAAEVEKLMQVVPPTEARHFLKATCNLPATELSTYVGFAKTLKGAEAVLRTGRSSFPVIKALVSADAETRDDVLARIAAGAQIDTRDISSIKRQLCLRNMAASDFMAARNKKDVAAAVRKQSKTVLSSFQDRMLAFIEELRTHFRKQQDAGSVVRDGLRHEAGQFLGEFESLFGKPAPEAKTAETSSPVSRLAFAYKILDDIACGRLQEFGPQQGSALRAVTGTSGAMFDPRPRKPVSELPPRHYRMRTVELCAGAGGMALGLERAGFEHVALVELNPKAAATLRKNRPDWQVIEDDVRKIDFTRFRKDNIDLVAGGLPCTPFSSVGERQGKNDEADLLMEGVRAVREIAPKAFIFENVEGLLHSKHSDHVASLLRKLSKAGYATSINRINTRDFGLAQDRSRILIIGIRKDLAGSFRMPPKFPHKATNIGLAIGDLIAEKGWSGARGWIKMMEERPSYDRWGNFLQTGALSDTLRRYQGSPQQGEARRAQRNGLSYAPPAKAAPTDDDARKAGFVPGLTPRMRARLQGFPDDWQFVGGISSVVDQIGNAVAPRMAQAVGLAMFTALRGMKFEWEALLFPNSERKLVSPPPLAPEHVSEHGPVGLLAVTG
ncbi:DNA (cytosine-5-)-methyltransferase [Rhizobium leguminosarum]|uniref:DNA cytosine methyltransferase n=1 Tax=Rhizobium leguminosarum TaxID=384 RepID=UPI0010302056|nr:DNA cytosine methyltransferase [Rhizobium leguminosarum]TBF35241.1 DNA (cytosine-5-)-methyltransferase [Rhizobium leguminosarum]